jgi:myo-inositol-1-phosphate synthase
VGRPLAEAIFADPNNTQSFATVPTTEAKVFRGPTHDGLGKYLSQSIEMASEEPVNVAEVLKDTQTDVLVSYLPVGSEIATGGTLNRLLKQAAHLSTVFRLYRLR